MSSMKIKVKKINQVPVHGVTGEFQHKNKTKQLMIITIRKIWVGTIIKKKIKNTDGNA